MDTMVENTIIQLNIKENEIIETEKAEENIVIINNSCSHGAKEILHAIRSKKDLDKASGAYKPINEVMRNQKDLVEILVELSPLGVIKE